jgi:micrococcal nuclease
MKRVKLIIWVSILLAAGIGFKTITVNNGAKIHDQNVINIPTQFAGVKTDEKLAPEKYISGYINKVSDGDTLQINYKGKNYKVRLLDVDTPESVKSGVAVQAFGKEATEFTKEMALDKEVTLFFEKDLWDRYGRLLAHVILKNGEYLNALLVRKGYARVQVLSPNTRYREYFNNLLKESILDKVGIWAMPENKRPFVKGQSGEYVPKYWSKVS